MKIGFQPVPVCDVTTNYWLVMLNGNRFFKFTNWFSGFFVFWYQYWLENNVSRGKRYLNVTVNVLCCLVKDVIKHCTIGMGPGSEKYPEFKKTLVLP